jgi:hypothetical protein
LSVMDGTKTAYRAVVVDTCAFSYGNFDVEKLKGLAKRLEGRGVELWIPSQVVYELAAHAGRALAKLKTAHKPLKNTGLVDEFKSRTASQIAHEFMAVCEDIPNVLITDMYGDSAVEAIKDQILGTGPGTVKSADEIRTGAVDSSWVRDVILESDANPASLIFLSANRRDIVATAAELGIGEGDIASCTREDQLFADFLLPDSSLDSTSVLGFIVDRLLVDIREAADLDDRHGPPSPWIEVSSISIARLPREDRESLERFVDDYTVELAPMPELVGLRDVSLSAEGGRVEVSYTVLLHGDITVEGLTIDNDGSAVPEWDLLQDMMLTVPYVAEVQKDGLGSPRQTDIAVARPSRREFDDAIDAFNWLYHDELCEWFGVAVEAVDVANEPPHRFRLRGPRGQLEEAVIQEASVVDGWTLDFEGASVALIADEAGSTRAWVGDDDDSYVVLTPITIHSANSSGRTLSSSPYAALSAVWARLMAAVDS